MRIEVSQVVEQPVAVVFRFFAHDHVRNHPRWDPDIELEQISDGPMEVGTVIRRRNIRSGTPVEGRMEVVEFEHLRAFGTVIQDGPIEMVGRTTFEAMGPNRTEIVMSVDIPGMDETTNTTLIVSRMERSARNISDLIEAEE